MDLIQWRSRERYIKLLLQTHSLEVDYSLLIMVMRLLDLGGVEISPVAAPEESSPHMVADSGSISVFLIYAPPPSRDMSGTFIYGGFRSRGPPRAFDGRQMMHEGQKRTGGAPRGSGRATQALSPLLAPFAWFQSWVPLYFQKIIILEKSPGNLSPYRSLKQ